LLRFFHVRLRGIPHSEDSVRNDGRTIIAVA
jgi:hypothetical protein